MDEYLLYNCDHCTIGMLEEFELSATVDSYTISNLHPYTNYTIKMAAVAQVGHGEFSVKKVDTLESSKSARWQHWRGCYVEINVTRLQQKSTFGHI